MKLTQNRLMEVLRYDPATGLFGWLVKPNRRIAVGQVAGCVKNTYVTIGVDGVLHYAHRLAWLYMTGDFPAGEVDHRNRIKHDNRWCNLREATGEQNNANKGVPSHNSSGAKGVSLCKRSGKWRAYVKKGRKSFSLGYYNSVSEAAKAASDAREALHGDFSA